MVDETEPQNIEQNTEQQNTTEQKKIVKTTKPKTEKVKKSGRPKMSKSEKEKRKIELENESKEAKFSRLVNVRIKQAVKRINSIGYLSSNMYSYSPDQVQKMENILNEAVKNTMNRFKSNKNAIEEIKI